jgi:hypothetical protein
LSGEVGLLTQELRRFKCERGIGYE